MNAQERIKQLENEQIENDKKLIAELTKAIFRVAQGQGIDTAEHACIYALQELKVNCPQYDFNSRPKGMIRIVCSNNGLLPKK